MILKEEYAEKLINLLEQDESQDEAQGEDQKLGLQLLNLVKSYYGVNEQRALLLLTQISNYELIEAIEESIKE